MSYRECGGLWVVRSVSMKNTVCAIRAPHGSRDLPAHRPASYIANSLWTGLSRLFLTSVCCPSIWVSFVLNLTNMKLLQDFRMSLAHPSFWGTNSLLSAFGGEWGCWEKQYEQLMWGISALMPLFWTLLHLKQTIYLLSAAYPANFLSLSLKKKIKPYNKSLHSSTGNSECHSTHTLLLLQLSHCLVLEIMMWIPLYQPFLPWLRLCQS